MSRKRWVYTQGGEPLPEPIEVTEDFTGAERRAQTVTEELVHGGARATDGTDISSRKKRREYMARTGVADASDFKNHWAQAEARKAESIRNLGDAKSFREAADMAGRAAYELSKKRRR